MKITTILPVSRMQYLDRVLESLKNQTYKPNNLVVVYDGDAEKFIQVRNKVVEQKYETVLCVQSVNKATADSIPDRRRHITAIHNQIKSLVGECDWIFSIEDDGILPPDALEKLITDMNTLELKNHVGMITGVELGRWGNPYVGAWRVDDVFNTQRITSLISKTNEDMTQSRDNLVEEMDAAGLYCSLIRADYYKSHAFYTGNGLGPDVNLGIYLRQQGLENYIDWTIHVTHLTFKDGQEVEIPATSNSRVVSLQLLSGSTWKH